MEQITFAMHEAEMARAERTQKRLVAIILVLIALLTLTNLGWLIYESQFETTSTSTEQYVEQEAENGRNLFVGGDYNGETDSSD